MNKKLLTLGTAVIVSSVLMIGSAFSAMASSSIGYETLKAALKQSHNFESVTTNAQLTVMDNGQTILDATSQIKSNFDQKRMTSNTKVEHEGQTKEIQTMHNGDQNIIKTGESDTYYLIETDEKHKKSMDKHHHSQNASKHEDVEKFVDALVGHYQSYFKLQQVEGKQMVTLELNDQDIPTAVNVLGSMLIKSGTAHHQVDKGQSLPFLKDFSEIKLPQLTEDVHLKEIKMQALINQDQIIEGYILALQASGQDDEGLAHDLTYQFKLNFSDFDKTNVAPIQLDGKTVEIIDSDEVFNKHH
jgi:hypothetical protein